MGLATRPHIAYCGIVAVNVRRRMQQSSGDVRADPPEYAGMDRCRTLDQLYAIFTDTVAANRDLAAGNTQQWADGKVLLAADAKAQGLIDAVGTRDNLLAKISQQEAPMGSEAAQGGTP